ncbi:MAG: hypothetical protein CMI14_10350 [Oleispira sp.]|nr:hypothetical protein [Oleispira sp.]|tara:strand:+ start:588 stop:791 length:204 start_codon:yes stop_codon:yes gene_type:complete
MKNVIVIALASLALSGCASNFTSIEESKDGASFYLTEVWYGPFNVTGTLYECDAESKTKMTCSEKSD